MDRYRVEKGDSRAYLCTCAFVDWLPIFNGGYAYFEVVLDSLAYCRRNKGLVLHAYVLMVDHLHLIARHEDMSGFIRDFKSWTARGYLERLAADKKGDWLEIMRRTVRKEGRMQEFQVWQDGFHPKSITSDAMMLQKMKYIHNNPVRKGFVVAPEDWRYSSARNYLRGDQSVLEIDLVGSLIV